MFTVHSNDEELPSEYQKEVVQISNKKTEIKFKMNTGSELGTWWNKICKWPKMDKQALHHAWSVAKKMQIKTSLISLNKRYNGKWKSLPQNIKC